MLYAYGPPSAQDAWALPPVTPEEGQPSFAAMLAEIARIVAEGHLWLVSGPPHAKATDWRTPPVMPLTANRRAGCCARSDNGSGP